jgi:DNA-binding NtrC family response regulator
MKNTCQVVVASSQLETRRSIATVLLNLALDPICVSKVSECRELLNRESVDLIFCDRSFADGDYRDILAASHHANDKPCVVLASRYSSNEYREAMEAQAFGVITVPCRPTDIEWMVIQAKRNQRKRLPAASDAAPQPEKATPAARREKPEKAFSAGAA